VPSCRPNDEQLEPIAGGTAEGEDGPVEIPETRYAATSDGIHIAYQTVGEGPGDLVFVPERSRASRYEYSLRRPSSVALRSSAQSASAAFFLPG
jgi:hypothetical protein